MLLDIFCVETNSVVLEVTTINVLRIVKELKMILSVSRMNNRTIQKGYKFEAKTHDVFCTSELNRTRFYVWIGSGCQH